MKSVWKSKGVRALRNCCIMSGGGCSTLIICSSLIRWKAKFPLISSSQGRPNISSTRYFFSFPRLWLFSSFEFIISKMIDEIKNKMFKWRYLARYDVFVALWCTGHKWTLTLHQLSAFNVHFHASLFSLLSTNQRPVYRSRDHPQSEASFKIIWQGFSLLSNVGNKRQFKCARIENVEIGPYDVKCNSKSSPQAALSGAMTFTLISSVI